MTEFDDGPPPLPDVPYLMTIGSFADEPMRCPIVHTAWRFGRCSGTTQATIQLICKKCGLRTVEMCDACVGWVIEYVSESSMGCIDQTPGHAVVAVESIKTISC